VRKLRLYLDTSVVNHLFHDDTPDRQEATLQFFEKTVRTGFSDAYVSFVTLGEIRRTRDTEKRDRLLTAVAEYNLKIIRADAFIPEARELATAYLARKILGPRERRDALHVALATVHELDALLSWNFRHLANVNKESMFQAVNLEFGYHKPLRMITPQEAIHEEN